MSDMIRSDAVGTVFYVIMSHVVRSDTVRSGVVRSEVVGSDMVDSVKVDQMWLRHSTRKLGIEKNKSILIKREYKYKKQ